MEIMPDPNIVSGIPSCTMSYNNSKCTAIKQTINVANMYMYVATLEISYLINT